MIVPEWEAEQLDSMVQANQKLRQLFREVSDRNALLERDIEALKAENFELGECIDSLHEQLEQQGTLG